MPAATPQPEPPVVTFARELDALMHRYDDVVEPIALALAMEGFVAAIVASYADMKDFDALREHAKGVSKLAMAKARLRN